MKILKKLYVQSKQIKINSDISIIQCYFTLAVYHRTERSHFSTNDKKRIDLSDDCLSCEPRDSENNIIVKSLDCSYYSNMFFKNYKLHYFRFILLSM
jgi:hypothetical protein